MVGILRMANREATPGLRSVSTFATSARPTCRFAKSANTGAIILHGPHQSA